MVPKEINLEYISVYKNVSTKIGTIIVCGSIVVFQFDWHLVNRIYSGTGFHRITFPTSGLLLYSFDVPGIGLISLKLLTGITENLITTLEKQLNWGIKACFNRSKFDHSTNLKIRHKILPARYFLDYKGLSYLWK